jgi:Spy/CpxP family protein refolding chaperone
MASRDGSFTQLYTENIHGKPDWVKVATVGAVSRPENLVRKGIPMNEKQSSTESMTASPANRKRRWTIAGIGAASVAAIAAIGTGWHARAHAHGPGFGMFGGPGMQGPMDPEAMGKRLDAMVSFALADIDATPDQKSRISSIARQAAADLAPLRKTHHDARQKSMALLTQPTIDRAQLEALRVQQMQLGDTVSRRMVQAIADAAEVLSADQRARLAQKWQARRGGRSS